MPRHKGITTITTEVRQHQSHDSDQFVLLPHYLTPVFLGCYFFFTVLRKLGAKWRNVEGKLNRPGAVLRYVNSKTYSPQNQRRVYIQKSSRVDDYKNFYLDTPEGQSWNVL